MILKDDLITTNPGDPNNARYDRIAKKYEELSARLAEQALLDEQKHKAMLESFEIVNKRILASASNLCRKPPVEAQEPNTNTDITDRASRRRAKQSQQELYANNRYWLATKRGL
jgi:hypothetical protein